MAATSSPSVVVLGVGPAGLAAAFKLSQRAWTKSLRMRGESVS